MFARAGCVDCYCSVGILGGGFEGLVCSFFPVRDAITTFWAGEASHFCLICSSSSFHPIHCANCVSQGTLLAVTMMSLNALGN